MQHDVEGNFKFASTGLTAIQHVQDHPAAACLSMKQRCQYRCAMLTYMWLALQHSGIANVAVTAAAAAAAQCTQGLLAAAIQFSLCAQKADISLVLLLGGAGGFAWGDSRYACYSASDFIRGLKKIWHALEDQWDYCDREPP